MARQIPLTQGKFATVDDEDYDWATQWDWCALRIGNIWYAVRKTTGPNRKTVYLHREIMKAPDGTEVDHEDRDGLNCQRQNMRLATHAQNNRNKGPHADNTSGYKGVDWHRAAGKWRAKIMVDRQHIHLGLYDDPAEAARAYDLAAREHHGAFAYQNFED